jgi:hypothetical protein
LGTVCSEIERWETEAMEAVGSVFQTWGIYLMPFLPVAGMIWFFGRRRVQWNRWDFSMVVLPSAVWITLLMVDATGKRMPNLIEILYVGCAAVLAPIVRVMVGGRGDQPLTAWGLMVTVCLAAIGLWAFVPGLPE